MSNTPFKNDEKYHGYQSCHPCHQFEEDDDHQLCQDSSALQVSASSTNGHREAAGAAVATAERVVTVVYEH